MNKKLCVLYKGKRDSMDLVENVFRDVLAVDVSQIDFIQDPENFVFESDTYGVYILVGEELLNKYLRVRGITKYAGKRLDIKEGFPPIVPVVSPGYLHHNPSRMETFAEDLLSAVNVCYGVESKPINNQYVTIETAKQFQQYFNIIQTIGRVSFDFETSKIGDMGPHDPDFKITSLSLSYQHGSAVVIPINHFQIKLPVEEWDAVLLMLQQIMADPDIIKIGQNIKFDMHCARRIGINVFRGLFHDTMIMSQLLDETTSNALKDQVKVYLPAYRNYDEGINLLDWDEIPWPQQAQYNALDTDLTLRLYDIYTDILISDEERIYNLFRNLSSPALMALFHAESNGMLVSRTKLNEYIQLTEDLIKKQEQKMRSFKAVKRYEAVRREDQVNQTIGKLIHKKQTEENKEYKTSQARKNQQQRIADIDQEIKDIKAGKIDIHVPINFNSPLQLADLMYDERGFGFRYPTDPVSGERMKGTGKEVLEYIADKTGFTDALLAYRQLTKLLSTYLKGILNKLDSDNKIHANFNQHVTKTGRLSSDKPNMQNIITRTKYDEVKQAVKYVKKSFVVPEGYTLLQADYSQAELRIVAHYADEAAMKRAYKEEKDFHSITAANIQGMRLNKFMELPEEKRNFLRFQAKSANFGLIYGMSVPGYRKYARVEYGIKMSEREAEDTRRKFFRAYSKLLVYHKIYIQKAKTYGYVRTLFGRKVRLPDLWSDVPGRVSHAERNAINSPIQGTAGELTIFAFALLQHRLDRRVLLVNTVHDSILYYVPDSLLKKSTQVIQQTMENLPIDYYFNRELSVPMKADFEYSKADWGSLEPLKL